MVTWDWNCKQGEVICKHNVMEIYKGNCFLVGKFPSNKERTEYWNMPMIWTDVRHARINLGLQKPDVGEKRNVFEGDWQKVILYRNKWDKDDFRKLVSMIAEAFTNITIEIREEE